MKVKINHNIWEVAEQVMTTKKVYIIWYFFVEWYGIEYVWLNDEWEQKFYKSCELKKSSDHKIWFLQFSEK